MSCATISPSAAAATSPRPTSPSFSRIRPHFNSQNTSDRLREGSGQWQPPFQMHTKIRKGRRSVFKELGLGDDLDRESCTSLASSKCEKRPYAADEGEDDAQTRNVRSERRSGDAPDDEQHRQDSPAGSPRRQQHSRHNSMPTQPWYAKLAKTRGPPRVKAASGAPPGSISGIQRFTMITMLIAVFLPAFSYYNGRITVEMSGADAGVIRKRADSPTQACARWAHQAALVNGTLYVYGGRSRSEEDQQENTWNNNFYTLDLTKSWDIDSPAFSGLPIPDGPPPVAMGYLWNDFDSLYLYGGQFSDKPYVDPERESLWKYSISSSRWTEFQNPETSRGNYSQSNGDPVHRAAEGAGISVPELGVSWYFGGHLDWATTPGWSRQIERVYLKSLIEFTHPGYTNNGVEKLSDGSGAADAGVFRNITEGGVQKDEFPERADGALVFVPGWGEMGILIGLAGGTNDTFVRDLRILDIYDIKNSEWYHQEAEGDIPSVRVNPCAVVASAPDASSFQIYLFGGQNLLPFGEQEQYDDMYILSIPSFTWVKVDANDNTPRGRAGHTCHLRDSQMVVVGGYVSNDPFCEDPGIYVFNTSSLEWEDKFTAEDHDDDYSIENTVQAGSYGYRVPDLVREVIGGGEEGSATVSTPAAGEARDGPFATGKPPVFTITEAGATATVTGLGPTGTPDGNGEEEDSGGSEISPGFIAAAVIAAIAGSAALYLGFCAWLYRRQVNAYKQHLAVSNRYGGVSNASLGGGALFGGRRHSSRRTQASSSSWAWRGSDREPKWLSEPKWYSSEDQPSSSGTGSARDSARDSAPKRSEDTRPGTSASGGSTEGLLEGQEPSFFSVVMGPRRALRVVNGIDER